MRRCVTICPSATDDLRSHNTGGGCRLAGSSVCWAWPRRPGPMALYLAVLVVACACIMLLALLDAWATRQYSRRLEGERLAAELKLAMELRSARESADADE